MAKKVIILASGGGHTGYAVALAQRLKGRADMLFIIPKGDKWTRSKVEKYGDVVEVVKARGPRDSIFKLVFKMPKAFLESLSKVRRDYEVIVSTGSNHSIPPSIIGKLKGLKLVNIESCVRFTKPSKSVKMLKPFSDILALQWEEQLKLFPQGKVYGPLFEEPEYKPYNGGYILVTGGTYGFKQLFDVMAETGLDNVVLQTGRVSPEHYRRLKPKWTIFDFDPDFAKWIAGAQLVISHLGKTIIDAALTYRKPVIIVPNPEWKLTAGIEDAKILAKKLNAICLEELSRDKLLEAIEEALTRTPPNYNDGAKKLAEDILQL